MKEKAFFIIFKGLSISKNCHKSKCAPLILYSLEIELKTNTKRIFEKLKSVKLETFISVVYDYENVHYNDTEGLYGQNFKSTNTSIVPLFHLFCRSSFLTHLALFKHLF